MPTATMPGGDIITPDRTVAFGGTASPAALAAAQALSVMAGLSSPLAPAPAAGGATVASGVQRAINKMGGCDSMGTILKELSFQTQFWNLRNSDSATATKQESDFMSKVASGAQIFGLVCMRGKFLRLIHLIGGYAGDLIDVCEYDRHVIGITGDRTDSMRPTAVTLGEQVEWKEDDEVVTLEGTFISFYASEMIRQRGSSP